jgi:predicted AAA+ superfamily ATPase
MAYTEKELERMKRNLGITDEEVSSENSEEKAHKRLKAYYKNKKVKKRKVVKKPRDPYQSNLPVSMMPPGVALQAAYHIDPSHSMPSPQKTHEPKLKDPDELEKLLRSYASEPKKPVNYTKLIDELSKLADEED